MGDTDSIGRARHVPSHSQVFSVLILSLIAPHPQKSKLNPSWEAVSALSGCLTDWCGNGNRGDGAFLQSGDRSPALARDEMRVKTHRRLDRGVPKLCLDVRDAFPGLKQR